MCFAALIGLSLHRALTLAETGTVVSQTIDLEEKKIWTFAAFSKGHHVCDDGSFLPFVALTGIVGEPRNASSPKDDTPRLMERACQDWHPDGQTLRAT